MGLCSAAAEAETRWLATLAEVRRQAARVAEAAGMQARTPALPPTRCPLCAVPNRPCLRTSCSLQLSETRQSVWSREAGAEHSTKCQVFGLQAPDADGTWFDVCEGRDTTPALETVDASGAWHSQQWLNAFCVMVRAWRRLRPFLVGTVASTSDTLSCVECGRFFSRTVACYAGRCVCHSAKEVVTLLTNPWQSSFCGAGPAVQP